MPIDFNLPSTWIDETLHDAPGNFNRAAYQESVDRICGTFEGKPNILVTWIPDRENYTRYYCEWDSAGFGTKSHLRAQYIYLTYDDGKTLIDIPPPRWAFKQRVDAAQYAMTDERLRWRNEVAGGITTTKEVRPPRPFDGYYAPFLTVAKHNGNCCAESKSKKLHCWGDYREPDEAYLNLLRIAVEQRSDTLNEQSPYEPISQSTLAEASREATEFERKRQEAADTHLDGVLDENLGEIVSYLFGKDAKPNAQEYSLPNYKKTESGILTPA